MYKSLPSTYVGKYSKPVCNDRRSTRYRDNANGSSAIQRLDFFFIHGLKLEAVNVFGATGKQAFHFGATTTVRNIFLPLSLPADKLMNIRLNFCAWFNHLPPPPPPLKQYGNVACYSTVQYSMIPRSVPRSRATRTANDGVHCTAPASAKCNTKKKTRDKDGSEHNYTSGNKSPGRKQNTKTKSGGCNLFYTHNNKKHY